MTPARRARRTPPIGPTERLDARISPSAIAVPLRPPVPTAAMHGSPPPKVQGPQPRGATSTMQKAGQILNIIYGEYQTYVAAGSTGTFTSSQSGRASISGTSVGVDIRAGGGDLDALAGRLKALGMTVTATSARFGIVEGTVPIAKLPAIAADAAVVGIDPILAATRAPRR